MSVEKKRSCHSESSKGGQELLYALPSSSVIPPCESSIVCPLTYLDSLAGRFGGCRAALAVQFLWNVWNAQLESQRRLRRRRLRQRLRRRQLASAAAPAVCLWLAFQKAASIHPPTPKRATLEKLGIGKGLFGAEFREFGHYFLCVDCELVQFTFKLSSNYCKFKNHDGSIALRPTSHSVKRTRQFLH